MKINDSFKLISSKISRNRIIMTPMDTLMANDGFVNDFHIQHYGARAYGGVGTIIVESTAISSEGKIRAKDLGIWSNDQIAGHKKIVDITKKAGSVIGVQLNHAGAKAEMPNEHRIGPSYYYDYLPMKNFSIISSNQIREVINKFVNAANRAQLAGYDFVEIHAAHGYLISSIINPKTNDIIKSKNILKRSKIVIDIVKRIKEEIKIPIGIRLSVTDHEEGGMIAKDFKPLIEKLDKYVDYFNISSGDVISKTNILKAMEEANNTIYRIPLGKEIKKWTKKPVMIAGNISDRKTSQEVIDNNIDGIGIGRELLFNPNLVINKLLKASEIDSDLYHWNDNIWFNPKEYSQLNSFLKTKNKKV